CGATVTSSLAHGSTSSSTIGGDHLASAFDAVGGGSGWRTAARGAGLGGGKPEAGSARSAGSGAATLVTAWCHGSTTSPCCARAALPTKSRANNVRENATGPKVRGEIA